MNLSQNHKIKKCENEFFTTIIAGSTKLIIMNITPFLKQV